MAVRTDEVIGDVRGSGHRLGVWGQLEQTPVDLGKADQQLAQLEVIAGHGPDLRHQLLAHVFGDRFLVELGGEVVTALGGIFMEGTLEQMEGGGDLAVELLLAELK